MLNGVNVKTTHPLKQDPDPFFLSSYQTVAYLGQGDELLVSWRAHVEADGQHLFKGRDNQGGLDGVVLAPTALVLPLLVPS